MKTPIHTSKKLEKLIKKYISKSECDQLEIGILGKWHANVFFVDRKKCWLVTNALTRYSVILANVSAADLNNIVEIFKNNLYSQIIYDGIFSDYQSLNQLLGDIEFFPTDNDRRTIGVQNSHFEELEFRKYEYGALENMPVKKITHNLNTMPYYRGKPNASNISDPISEMKKLMTL